MGPRLCSIAASVLLIAGRTYAQPRQPDPSPHAAAASAGPLTANPSDASSDSGQAPASADSQQTPPGDPIEPEKKKGSESSPDDSLEQRPKRILWIIPNYRSSPSLKNYRPLTPKEKFKIASQDSFDRGTFVQSALFGGLAHLTRATPSFGDGVAAYSQYFAASYADFAIGNFMTEAIYPTVFHQDPRYFRRGTGSGWSRLGYAMSQIFWTHKDSGGMQFNFSEIVGNSTAVAIANVYYPNGRTASSAISKLGVQIGVDMAGNILKEFSPELNRAFSRKRHARADAQRP